MSCNDLPEPYASILAAYLTKGSLEEIADANGLTVYELARLIQSEPLASALVDIEEQTRRRNLLVYAQTALRVLAEIAATSPDPVERRRAAADVLRFLTPLCKITGQAASVLIFTGPPPATLERAG